MLRKSQHDCGDDFYDLLADSRRRILLTYLSKAGDSVELRELAREIILQETDSSPENIDKDDLRKVYFSLYFSHIPLLVEHDVVECDYGEHVISAGKRFSAIMQILDDQDESIDSWAILYLVIGSLLGVTILLKILPAVSISKSVLSMVTTGGAAGLLFVTFAQYLDVRMQ